jgi:hypothetical protein
MRILRTTEALNKEEKSVFELHHLTALPASASYCQKFVAFAANFVRWTTLWLL